MEITNNEKIGWAQPVTELKLNSICKNGLSQFTECDRNSKANSLSNRPECLPAFGDINIKLLVNS